MTGTRELAQEGWSEYLDAVSRELLDTRVSVRVSPEPGAIAVETEQLALQMLTYDQRNDVFEVTVARDGPTLPSVVRHVVAHPVRIEVDSPVLLAPLTIAVDGDGGARAVIRIEHEAELTG